MDCENAVRQGKLKAPNALSRKIVLIVEQLLHIDETYQCIFDKLGSNSAEKSY